MPANGSALHTGSRLPRSGWVPGTMADGLMAAPDPRSSRAGASAGGLAHRAPPLDEPASVALHELVLVAAGREHQARGIRTRHGEPIAPRLRPVCLGTVDHHVGDEMPHHESRAADHI